MTKEEIIMMQEFRNLPAEMKKLLSIIRQLPPEKREIVLRAADELIERKLKQ